MKIKNKLNKINNNNYNNNNNLDKIMNNNFNNKLQIQNNYNNNKFYKFLWIIKIIAQVFIKILSIIVLKEQTLGKNRKINNPRF